MNNSNAVSLLVWVEENFSFRHTIRLYRIYPNSLSLLEILDYHDGDREDCLLEPDAVKSGRSLSEHQECAGSVFRALCIVIVVNFSCQTRIMCLYVYFVVWLVTFAHPLPFTGSLSPNPRGGYTSGPGYWSCDPFPLLPLHVVHPRAHSSPLRHNGPIRLDSAFSVFHVVTERVKRGNFHILSRGNAIMFLCVVQLKIPFVYNKPWSETRPSS